MENKIENRDKLTKRDYLLSASIIMAGIIFAFAWLYGPGGEVNNNSSKKDISQVNEKLLNQSTKSVLEEKVLPTEGVVLPVVWGDLGQKLISVGAIDGDKFKTLYQGRGE